MRIHFDPLGKGRKKPDLEEALSIGGSGKEEQEENGRKMKVEKISLKEYLNNSLKSDNRDLCRGWHYLKTHITEQLKKVIELKEYWDLTDNYGRADLVLILLNENLNEELKKQLYAWVFIQTELKRKQELFDFGKTTTRNWGKPLEEPEENMYSNDKKKTSDSDNNSEGEESSNSNNKPKEFEGKPNLLHQLTHPKEILIEKKKYVAKKTYFSISKRPWAISYLEKIEAEKGVIETVELKGKLLWTDVRIYLANGKTISFDGLSHKKAKELRGIIESDDFQLYLNR